ncbi:MAG TPA: hypothetical protein VF608_02750 [Thermoanaerobaculia bacterium]
MSALIDDAERILRECFASFAQYPGATLIDDALASGVITNIPITFFSGIAATHIENEADIDRVAARFRERNAPFRWWLTPSTRPHDLETHLLARGFHHAYDANGMVADLATVDFDLALPEGLTIKRLAHVDEFDAWLDVFAATFGRPDEERALWRDAYAFFGFEETSQWLHFVGFVDGKPVSTTSLLMAGDVGGSTTSRRSRRRAVAASDARSRSPR